MRHLISLLFTSSLIGCSFLTHSPDRDKIRTEVLRQVTHDIVQLYYFADGATISLPVSESPCSSALIRELQHLTIVPESSRTPKVTIYCAIIGDGLATARLSIANGRRIQQISQLYEFTEDTHDFQVMRKGPTSRGEV